MRMKETIKFGPSDKLLKVKVFFYKFLAWHNKKLDPEAYWASFFTPRLT